MPAEKKRSTKKLLKPVRAAKASAVAKPTRKTKLTAVVKPATKIRASATPKVSAKTKPAIVAKPASRGKKKSVEKPVLVVEVEAKAVPLPAKTKLKAVPSPRAKVKPVVESEPPVARIETIAVGVPIAAPLAEKNNAPSAPKEKSPELGTAVGVLSETKIRADKLAAFFGPSLPKGKGVNSAGEPITSEELAGQGFSVLQFPPKTGRLTWVYVTSGLSTARATGKDTPTRVELVIHWREKDTLPIQVLVQAAKHILQTGCELKAGDSLGETEGVVTPALMAKHFFVLDADPSMPRVLPMPSGEIRPLVLLGISQEEMDAAMKVRPELADGRLVLMGALRGGGVFPVTDPRRQCMTRRRDFLRIWESAFRNVRARKT